MLTVAYLANQFPSPVEPYVFEEVEELRRRGVRVISCSARAPDKGMEEDQLKRFASETLYLQPWNLRLLLSAGWLCLRNFAALADLWLRVWTQGSERPGRRGRALLHTLLGACYAQQLKQRGVEHIHVHHGYFASWIAMVAARLLGIGYSVTLHGSDLLMHAAYLNTKLEHCEFCVTVSEFNRRFILERYPRIEPAKIIVRRMGVNSSPAAPAAVPQPEPHVNGFRMLSVGRLHAVKDHAFLLRACYELKILGISFSCHIAGEGPQRPWLEHLIRNLGLAEQVKLLGHLSRTQLDACYATSDLVVLNSQSEGIPLVLMEAMAAQRIVLAPAITGIPELVRDGETGFLYRPGSVHDFVGQVEFIRKSQPALARMGRAARQHVREHFDREKNLAAMADLLVFHLTRKVRHRSNENPLLQQI